MNQNPESTEDRLVRLCGNFQQLSGNNVEELGRMGRKQRAFRAGLAVSPELRMLLDGVPDDQITTVAESILFHTEYMQPDQAAAFLCRTLTETYGNEVRTLIPA